MNASADRQEVAKQWSEVLATKLEPLRPFAERISTIRRPLKRQYSACLRASFVKSFEFVDFATKQQSDDAFFLAPVLRGITEDVIFLRFMSRFPHNSRELVIHNRQLLEVHNDLEKHILNLLVSLKKRECPDGIPPLSPRRKTRRGLHVSPRTQVREYTDPGKPC